MQQKLEDLLIPQNTRDSRDKIYSIDIAESREPLIPLSLAPERFLARSNYFELGMPGTTAECYARMTIRELLLKAATLLPQHLRLVVLDAWRSKELQQYLYQQCQNALERIYPDLNKEEITAITQQYVAPPQTKPEAPPPHFTGGAVDLLIATKDGMPLFFGSPFDDPNEISATRYFEEKLETGDTLSAPETTALRNRRLLYHVMTKAGFVNLVSEWWHFEYGTQRWAYQKEKDSAIYGGIEKEQHPFQRLERTKNANRMPAISISKT